MWNISLRSMWNEICPCSRSEHFTFAKQIFHREAISLAQMGKFRWATCFTVGRPRDTYHKAGFTSRKRKKEYERFVRTPFHTPCPARYSVLHLLGVLSGGKHIVKCFAIAKREIICECILWNISLCSMWNEICPRSQSEHFTFAKQIFHREAISLARKGKFRWGTCFIAGAPMGAFHKADFTYR